MSKTLKGLVVSHVRDKTICVSVSRSISHPIYKKVIKKITKYHVHDPENNFKKGDYVEIRQVAPISKTKFWTVIY